MTDIRNIGLKAATAFAAVAIVAGAGYAGSKDIIPTKIPAQNYGVRIRSGVLIDKHRPPGIVWTRLFWDDVHILKENVIIMDERKTCTGENTQDHNMLSAKMRLHYKNNPESGVIQYHAEDMAKDDGKALLGGLMDQTCNAVAGKARAVDSLNDPKKFLYGFVDPQTGLQWRLTQNSVAIELDAAELLDMTVGDGNHPLRMPTQIKLRHQKGQWIEDNNSTQATTGPVPTPPAP